MSQWLTERDSVFPSFSRKQQDREIDGVRHELENVKGEAGPSDLLESKGRHCPRQEDLRCYVKKYKRSGVGSPSISGPRA